MSKCDLTIELDQSTDVFHPGDEISGHVVVRTDQDVRCDGLDVELNWRTHGRGSVASGDAQTIRLFEGEWADLTNLRYSFQFTVPGGPVTYHGHYLNVAWTVRAHADIPWKFDPKAEVEFALTSGPETEQRANWESQFAGGYQPDLSELIADAQRMGESDSSATGGASSRQSWSEIKSKTFASPASTAIGLGCVGIGLLLLLGFVGLFGAWAWDGVHKASAGDWGGAIPGLIVAVVMVLIVLGLTWAIVSQRMLKSRFGTIDHGIEPDRAEPGEGVSVRVSFTPEKDTLINRSTVQLVAFEEVVSGSGTNRKTRRHSIHDQEFELSAERRLMARQPVILETEVVIPATAPPSFKAHRNELTWKIITHVDIARFPDWGETKTVVVMPH